MSSQGSDEICGSSDVYVIKPDNIVFKNPIEIFYQENKIVINNLLTFFSFKKPSNRLRARLELTISKIIRKIIKKRGYRNIRPNVRLTLSEKTSNLSISLPEEELIEKKEVIDVTKSLFSKTCQDVPDYSVREYYLLPMSEDYYTFFILLMPYRPEIKNTLDTLRKILDYPFVTLPDEKGEYYSSEWKEDNLFGAPRIVQKKLLGVVRTVYRSNLKGDVAKIYGHIGGELINDFLTSPEFLSTIFKELAQTITSTADARRFHEFLGIINKFMRNEILDPKDIERAFNCLNGLIREKNNSALSKLCDYFQALTSEIKLFESLEKVCIARSAIKKISRIINQESRLGRNIKARNIVNTLFRSYLLTGSVIAKRRKKLINLGGGKAIYISPREWKILLAGINNIGEEAKIELKIIRRSDGKKSIVIEVIEE